MSTTLREQYEKRIVAKQKQALVLEAFDKQQMAAAIDVVKKLKALNFGALGSLASARDAAIEDITKVLAGTKTQGIVRKIVNLFSSEKENPFVDVIAFADAMYNFFADFSQYMTSLGSEDVDQSLATVVTGKSAKEFTGLDAARNLGQKEKGQLKDLQKIIMTGFKPEGMLAKVSKTWIDKYMKGTKGLQQLAKEMMGVSIRDLNNIAENVNKSLSNVSAVGQAVSNAAQQSSIGTTGTTGTEAAKSSEQSTGTSGTKSAATGPASPEKPAQSVSSRISNAYKNIKDDIANSGLDAKEVVAILKALADKNLL